MEVFRLLFEIKNNFLCKSPFQILLTNLKTNLKGFSMPKVPKCKSLLNLSLNLSAIFEMVIHIGKIFFISNSLLFPYMEVF